MIKNILLFFSFFLIFNLVLAQNFSGLDQAGQKAVNIIINIAKFLFTFFMILASAFLIYLGIIYIIGKTEIKTISDQGIEVKKAIIYIVIGVVFLMIASFVPNLIKSFIQDITS